MKRILIPTVGLAVCTACAFDEGLVIENMEGRIMSMVLAPLKD